MINYYKITDQELAKRAYSYIDRLEALGNKISQVWYQHRQGINKQEIREEYKLLKQQIREESHDIQLSVNGKKNPTKLFRCYKASIVEASAFGLTVPTNGSINQIMGNAVEEAHYKLTKFIDKKEWGKIADGENYEV